MEISTEFSGKVTGRNCPDNEISSVIPQLCMIFNISESLDDAGVYKTLYSFQILDDGTVLKAKVKKRDIMKINGEIIFKYLLITYFSKENASPTKKPTRHPQITSIGVCPFISFNFL